MNSSRNNSNFVPLQQLLNGDQTQRYWRSMEDFYGLAHADDFENTEFPDNASQAPDESSRRRFISLMAGSLALAGLTGCTRQPTEVILPYVHAPENALPGIPKFYATAVPVGGVAQGVVVESHLGRPTKVDGNSLHPASLGATSVLSQACLMDLYDPDRARDITYLGEDQTWEEFIKELSRALEPIRTRQGEGLHILTGTVTSPTLGSQLRALLKALPSAQWRQYDAAGEHSARTASRMAFGRDVNTYYNFADADVVLSLDSDFLAFGHASTRYAHDFASRRRQGDRLDMNRLYVVESSMTSTGGKADHRLPLRYADIEQFVCELAATLEVTGLTGSSGYANQTWLETVARDLSSHRGRSIVIAGEHQSSAVHGLVHAINSALKNAGKTVIYTDSIEVEPVDQLASLRALVNDIDAGKVEMLLILGGNPVYNAPADIKFADRLPKLKTSIRVGLHNDETSACCKWNIPESHFLEDWGDARSFDGSITILQPLIYPLYNSRSYIQILDAILQAPGRSAYDIVCSYWSAQHGSEDFEHWWRKSVCDGLIAGSGLPPISPPLKTDWLQNWKPQSPQGTEIVFRPDIYMFDGRYANNVWLQELPHPMTKLTWDNAVHMNPDTARRLNFANQQRIELQLQGRSVEAAVWIAPGQPANSVTVHLGYGRWRSGRAGNGSGFNAYALRSSETLWTGSGIQMRKLSKPYPLATTQMHQYMEGRDLVISGTVSRYKEDPGFVQNIEESPPDNLTLYPHWQYSGYAWGMSIDLTACVNCSACVVACQAENNIPVVGKQQVLARRAMHWLRIDTYYKGGPDYPTAYYQPVPCMQCENAPCELVCPVQATNHSSDGLNDMVYNRCIGTRYCANNCPYKVRRFNFFLYQDWTTETLKLQRNPDVTVRSRGVMEKCTYCVQRIRESEIHARDEDRYIRDGEIQTACQQACPTQAIIFGDINNKNNRVARLKAEKLNYALLAELNTRPRTTYLAELRNPNPDIDGGRT